MSRVEDAEKEDGEVEGSAVIVCVCFSLQCPCVCWALGGRGGLSDELEVEEVPMDVAEWRRGRRSRSGVIYGRFMFNCICVQAVGVGACICGAEDGERWPGADKNGFVFGLEIRMSFWWWFVLVRRVYLLAGMCFPLVRFVFVWCCWLRADVVDDLDDRWGRSESLC